MLVLSVVPVSERTTALLARRPPGNGATSATALEPLAVPAAEVIGMSDFAFSSVALLVSIVLGVVALWAVRRANRRAVAGEQHAAFPSVGFALGLVSTLVAIYAFGEVHAVGNADGRRLGPKPTERTVNARAVASRRTPSDPEKVDRGAARPFALVGWVAAVAALVGGGGATALALRGADHDVVGVLVLVALVSIAGATHLVGAPFARSGKPSLARIALLFVASFSGAVLTVLVASVVALGVGCVSHATALAALRRWPPDEWLELPSRERIGRIPIGGALAAAGTLRCCWRRWPSWRGQRNLPRCGMW